MKCVIRLPILIDLITECHFNCSIACCYCLRAQWVCSEEIYRNSRHPSIQSKEISGYYSLTGEEAAPQEGWDLTAGPAVYVTSAHTRLCLRCWEHLKSPIYPIPAEINCKPELKRVGLCAPQKSRVRGFFNSSDDIKRYDFIWF